jgi:hypothetical protein
LSTAGQFRIDARALCVVMLSIVLMCVTSARAESGWVLTSPDFRSEPVDLKSIDAAGVHVEGAENVQRTISFDQFLQIERTSIPRSRGAAMLLCLNSGDRICGQPISVSGEQLHFRSAALGELIYPLRQVVALVKPGQVSRSPGNAATEDVIRLSNGDTVRGIISDITADAISIQPTAGGELSQVPLSSVAAAELASTAGGAPTSQPTSVVESFRVSLADGSALSARSILSNQNELQIAFQEGQTSSVPLGIVTSIEHVNGPIVWLSSLQPVEAVFTPYFGEHSAGSVTQPSVERGGNVSHLSGREIGVHSYSKLTFDISSAHCQAFRTQYGIDGDLPYADVTARIMLDGQRVWERKNVRAGQPPAPVIVPVAGHRQLTLEVDYGENYDVQDRFTWVEPALLRALPTTAPSTKP